MSLTREHDYEPIPGLPDLLPEGEQILWQGAPEWKDLAIAGLHVRKLVIYFALILGARVLVQNNAGTAFADTLVSTAILGVLALLAVGFLTLFAWLAARSTRYTITNQRLVIRCGVTLPISTNLPFSLVQSAELRVRDSGIGDLPMTLEAGSRPSWIMLWPHVRPWSIGSVQPMMRSVADAAKVGEILADALVTYKGSRRFQAGNTQNADHQQSTSGEHSNLSASAG